MFNEPIRLMLVDDHLLIRDALATLIQSFDNMQIIGSHQEGKELLTSLAQGKRPDVVLLDLNMSGMDGFQTASALFDTYPDVKILVLTMYDSEIALIRLLRYGVKGFLKKDTHPRELREAIQAVADGGYFYSHDTTGRLAGLFQRGQGDAGLIEKAMLSDREIEFLKLASTDLTYKEIAHKMQVTTRAIDGFRDALFEKLDVKSRVGLAIYAVKNGIVTF